MDRIVVVGGGLAGLEAARAVRASGFSGQLTIVGDETEGPYDRPPLSKQILAGRFEPAAADLEIPDDLRADWLRGTAAESLSLADGRLGLSGRAPLAWDGLVVATGARPRRLPGSDLAGVHYLRTRADSLALRRAIEASRRGVAVVGAGFIGAEVAATARGMGAPVTLIDPLDGPLIRVVGSEVSAAVADLHAAHGVELRLGVGVDGFDGDDELRGVTLSDGSTVRADVAVVGIGVIPNTEWAEGSGLEIDGGLVCDSTTRAAPGVVGAGDVARWDHPRYGPIRLEHWDNAVAMGGAAGARLMADDDAEPFAPVPWFWSDQFDLKLQMAGHAGPDAVSRLVAGSVADDRFLVGYGTDEEVTAVVAWNWPARVVKARMALAERLTWADLKA